MKINMASSRCLLTLILVFLVIVVRAANSNNSGVGRPTVSKCHNTYTYNNFYAGLNKKVENLLREVKHELKEMNGNPKLCKGAKNDLLQRRFIRIAVDYFPSTNSSFFAARFLFLIIYFPFVYRLQQNDRRPVS